MTEADWNSCTDPQAMLSFLQNSGKLSDRKARQFACACCRRVWHLLVEAAFREAVETAERFAEGEATAEILQAAWKETFRHGEYDGLSDDPLANARFWAADAATQAACELERASSVASSAAWAASWQPEAAADVAFDREKAVQCDLLRCIFSGSFRPRPIIAPTCLAWNDGIVGRLARSIRDIRCFEDAPVLADALEEAGCDNVDILDHLRGPGPHTRGCWPVDLILGRS